MEGLAAGIGVQIVNMFFSSSSSSSSSSEDDEYNNPVFKACSCRKIPRITNYIERVVNNYNEKEFMQNFRISRAKVDYLVNLIGPDIAAPAIFQGHPPTEAGTQILIALWYFGTPDSYRSITTKFNVALATAFTCVYRVTEALYAHRNYFISWPTQEEQTLTSNRIFQKYGFPGVMAILDGSQAKIPVPKLHKESYYNKKKFHSIQFQTACNNRLNIVHFFSGFPGSVHDSRVFSYSGIQNIINDGEIIQNGHILADKAYTLQENVITPYKNNGFLTPEQIRYNKTLSKIRIRSEHCLALLKNRWRILLDKMDVTRIWIIPFYIATCSILHNICLLRYDALLFLEPIPGGDPLGPLHPTALQRQLGVQKRNNVRDIVNAWHPVE